MPANADPNSMDLSQYRGRIRPCEYCKPEETLLGRSCQWCMSQGYLAACTNCNGKGQASSPAVWDAGRSQHISTCTPCGGKGAFPVRAAEYNKQQSAAPSNGGPRSVPLGVTSMKHLGITSRR